MVFPFFFFLITEMVRSTSVSGRKLTCTISQKRSALMICALFSGKRSTVNERREVSVPATEILIRGKKLTRPIHCVRYLTIMPPLLLATWSSDIYWRIINWILCRTCCTSFRIRCAFPLFPKREKYCMITASQAPKMWRTICSVLRYRRH